MVLQWCYISVAVKAKLTVECRGSKERVTGGVTAGYKEVYKWEEKQAK
jgi:hypothetical protein